MSQIRQTCRGRISCCKLRESTTVFIHSPRRIDFIKVFYSYDETFKHDYHDRRVHLYRPNRLRFTVVDRS